MADVTGHKPACDLCPGGRCLYVKKQPAGVKPDELAMMRRVLADPRGRLRDGAGDIVYVTKREHYVLLKWTGRGWWDYGVSARCGWLTDKGREGMAAVLATGPEVEGA